MKRSRLKSIAIPFRKNPEKAGVFSLEPVEFPVFRGFDFFTTGNATRLRLHFEGHTTELSGVSITHIASIQDRLIEAANA